MIEDDLSGRSNQRIIVFMTDGIPDASYRGEEELVQLRDSYGVDYIYGIDYAKEGGSYTDKLPDIFEKTFGPEKSQIIKSNSANLTGTFKDIIYNINTFVPEEIVVDQRLDISDMEVSEGKPMKIIVTQNGILVKEIIITEYPTSSEGVVIIEGGIMYLVLENLAEECGLKDFDGVNVSVEYYSNK